MRFRGVACLGAAIVSLAFLAINVGFEAAGSVPDVETCGFLAGNSLALALLYPLAAALISLRATRSLVSRGRANRADTRRVGGFIGLVGAAIYLGAGVAGAFARSGPSAVPPGTWILIASYLALCAFGGLAGALRAAGPARDFALESGEDRAPTGRATGSLPHG